MISQSHFQSKDSSILTRVQAAGGVVCRKGSINWDTIIVGSGTPVRWRLPKGIVEPNESLAHAALREVQEETGVIAIINSEIGVARWGYVFNGQAYEKETTFFLMFYVSGDFSGRDSEFEHAIWLPLVEVHSYLSFASEVAISEKAISLLQY